MNLKYFLCGAYDINQNVLNGYLIIFHYTQQFNLLKYFKKIIIVIIIFIFFLKVKLQVFTCDRFIDMPTRRYNKNIVWYDLHTIIKNCKSFYMN
jgi:hypothetical protein